MENLDGRWGQIFLITDTRLKYQDRMKLTAEATTMFLEGVDKRCVRGENYEGRIWTDNNYVLMGQFGGLRYDAEVDVNGVKGKVKLSFLIDERTAGRKINRRVACMN